MTTETTATETAETKAVTEVEADSVVAATTTVEDSPKEDDPTTGVADETAPTLERDERTILDSDAPLSTIDDEVAEVMDEKVVARINLALEALRKDSKIFGAEEEDDAIGATGDGPKGSLSDKKVRQIPRLDWNDLKIGKLLGEGGFNTVHLVHIPGGDDDDEEEYALKALRPFKDDIRMRMQGAADLTTEGCFLKALQHPNLVKVHAMSHLHAARPFLVLDKLSCTLEKRMEEWKVQQEEALKHVHHRPKLLEETRLSHLSERLLVAMDIACALQHLHKHSVVYRDLKPENVGFDQDNNVVLFDLGLAKEMKNPLQTGKYKLTGETGSWYYMAPEVAKNWAYDASVDIYSFGILLWELSALRSAFSHLDFAAYKERVIAGEERPKLPTNWPVPLQRLIQKSWAYFAAQRPKWETIQTTLHDVVEQNPVSHSGLGSENDGRTTVSERKNARSNTLSSLTGFFMGHGNNNNNNNNNKQGDDKSEQTSESERKRTPQRPRRRRGARSPGRWVVSDQAAPPQTATTRQRAPRRRRVRQATADAASTSQRQQFFHN